MPYMDFKVILVRLINPCLMKQGVKEVYQCGLVINMTEMRHYHF